jgi:CubicO group peptidase (beta-lactamase class C family)
MRQVPQFEEASPLNRFVQEIVHSDAAPTAACAVRYRVADRWFGANGIAERTPKPDLVTSKLLFDLASVTKPFFAMAVHTAVANGQLSLATRLSELLPCVLGTNASESTVEALLSHRSGLVPHVELYRALQVHYSPTKPELLRVAASSMGAKGRYVTTSPLAVYSDLGYLLLGAAIETHFNTSLDQWCENTTNCWWKQDVGSIRQWLSRPTVSVRNFVPTENVPWRGGLLTGVVHDENAWLLSGHGMSGHAGLFATVDAVAHFGVMLLDALSGRDSPIAPIAAIRATASRPGGTLCAGFDRRAETGSAAGSFCSRETFGHLGFTGTSIWCDPTRAIVVVLLTNRVNPSRENLRLRHLRPFIHDALFEWAETQRAQAVRSQY